MNNTVTLVIKVKITDRAGLVDRTGPDFEAELDNVIDSTLQYINTQMDVYELEKIGEFEIKKDFEP